MFGKGLLTGMGITWKHLWGKKSTFCYPEEKLPMTEHFRGGHLQVDLTKCVGCRLCAIQCPNKALEVKVEMDANKKRHVVQYIHTLGRCLYCDLCIEGCNFHALTWDKNFSCVGWHASDMVYDAVAEAKLRQPPEPEPEPEKAEPAKPEPAKAEPAKAGPAKPALPKTADEKPAAAQPAVKQEQAATQPAAAPKEVSAHA